MLLITFTKPPWINDWQLKLPSCLYYCSSCNLLSFKPMWFCEICEIFLIHRLWCFHRCLFLRNANLYKILVTPNFFSYYSYQIPSPCLPLPSSSPKPHLLVLKWFRDVPNTEHVLQLFLLLQFTQGALLWPLSIKCQVRSSRYLFSKGNPSYAFTVFILS